MKITLSTLALIGCTCAGLATTVQAADQNKKPSATSQSKTLPPAPFGVLPTEAQVNWQRMEFYAFVHFGLNTWTGREWGYGDENPAMFNPTDFNAEKIVKTFKNAGMKGMIYTAKHHDGWCSWPTKTTGHNITKSPWKKGKGDVVAEFAKACKNNGIKFGTYLSPWDRNNAEYGRDGYLKTYYGQIEELLTHYGPIFEIWFDGANGGDGFYGGSRERRQINGDYYNFEQIVKNIRKLQPNCIIWGASHYGDARWGGSEKGHVDYPHWSTLSSTKQGSGGTGNRGGDRWVPAEGDTTINHSGWFWHAGQSSRVKSPEQLLNVWFDCVGRGANLILNVAADQTGNLDPADVKSLLAFKELRDRLYANDFAKGAKAKASETRGNSSKFSPANMVDDNIDTYWAVEDGNLTPSAEIQLTKPATFDVVRLREQIRLGQRVDSFEVDTWENGAWKTIIKDGKTIGNQVMMRLPEPVTTDKLRLRITGSQATPCISEFSLLRKPVIIPQPEITRQGDRLHIPGKPGCTIKYTTDGTTPTAKSPTFTGDIAFAKGGIVNACYIDKEGNIGPVKTARFGVPKKDWKIITTTAGDASKAIDDDPKTFWHTHMAQEQNPPQSFTVDMGAPCNLTSFSYLPRQDGTTHGMTDRYIFEVSQDGQTWKKAAEGEFSNLRANPIELNVAFKQKEPNVRYFRFTGTRALDKNHVSAAEIAVFE